MQGNLFIKSCLKLHFSCFMASSQHAFFLAWVVEFRGSRAYNLYNQLQRWGLEPVLFQSPWHSIALNHLYSTSALRKACRNGWLRASYGNQGSQFLIKKYSPSMSGCWKLLLSWGMRYFENHLGQINQIVCICLIPLKWCCTSIYWMKMSTNNVMLLIKARPKICLELLPKQYSTLLPNCISSDCHFDAKEVFSLNIYMYLYNIMSFQYNIVSEKLIHYYELLIWQKINCHHCLITQLST